MTGTPRILHILDTLNPSGAERLLEAIGPLGTGGMSADILAGGEDGPGPFAGRLERAGYRIVHLPFRRSPLYFAALWGLVRRGRYDVVHLHPERAFIWMALAARLAGVRRLVRTVHAVFAFEAGLRRRRAMQRYIARRLLGVTFTAFSGAVVENEADRFGNPVKVLPPWLDTGLFRPPARDERLAARSRFGISPGCFAIGCLGSCEGVKNHKALIQAVHRLRDAGRDIVLLHAGTGADEDGEKELANALQLADRVRFAGAVDDAAHFLSALDAFAMPSHREGLGMAALEALACGVPSVLTQGTGMDALNDFGAAIAWCEPEPVSIADALQRVMDRPADRRAIDAAACARLAAERFGASQGWKALRDLYGSGPDAAPGR